MEFLKLPMQLLDILRESVCLLLNKVQGFTLIFFLAHSIPDDSTSISLLPKYQLLAIPADDQEM
jgi:hypothetical protein